MKDIILVGRRDKILEVSADTWRHHLANARNHSETRLSFMTDNHRLVRNFVVRELPRNSGKPLTPEDIAQRWLCCKKSSRNAMATQSLLALSSDCHSKQAGDECDLTYDVSFIYPSHLPRPPHVHDLISLQGSPCALERKEA